MIESQTTHNPPFDLLPDANLAVIVTQNGDVVARCALWWSGNIPTLPGHKVGVIGQYEATQNGTAEVLLAHACAELAAQGCTIALGPMDGNTWRRYRFVTHAGNNSDSQEPPFFLEPTNLDSYPDQFLTAGFTPLATYSSRVTQNLDQHDPRTTALAERFAQKGVSFRSLNPAQIDNELHRIYELSCISFQNNFLYTPLPEDEFFASYQRILPYLRSELVQMAEAPDGELIGFVFTVPDLAELKRGKLARTVIVKTIAVLPGREWAGLGRVLLDRCHSVAANAGFTRAIHALMHDSNASRNLSLAYGADQLLRQYTLYEKPL